MIEHLQKDRRIPGLDGLRGLAVIAVLVYHSSPTQVDVPAGRLVYWIRSGLWTGVDLFFVLSGFLITGILLDTRRHQGYYTVFFIRRALRILPLYYLLLAAVLLGPRLAGVFLPQFSTVTNSEGYLRLWYGQAWLWLYLHNFAQATGPHRFPGMGHLWSLAIEEQFYIVWPLVLRVVPNARAVKFIMLTLGVVVMARFIGSIYGLNPWAIMHVTLFRLDGLLIGSLIAVIIRNTQWNAQLRAWRPRLFAASSLAIVSIWVSRGTFEWTDPIVQQLGYVSFCIFAGCLVHFVAQESRHDGSLCEDALNNSGSLQRMLCWRWLRSWGKYSYAIYVVHWPIVHVVKSRSWCWLRGCESLGIVLLVAAISYTAAWFSWHFYEKHWLKLKPAY